jgi:hypothetical protein
VPVRRTAGVRLRATARFPCQDKKFPHSRSRKQAVFHLEIPDGNCPVIDHLLFDKKLQPVLDNDDDWRNRFTPD